MNPLQKVSSAIPPPTQAIMRRTKGKLTLRANVTK